MIMRKPALGDRVAGWMAGKAWCNTQPLADIIHPILRPDFVADMSVMLERPLAAAFPHPSAM